MVIYYPHAIAKNAIGRTCVSWEGLDTHTAHTRDASRPELDTRAMRGLRVAVGVFIMWRRQSRQDPPPPPFAPLCARTQPLAFSLLHPLCTRKTSLSSHELDAGEDLPPAAHDAAADLGLELRLGARVRLRLRVRVRVRVRVTVRAKG